MGFLSTFKATILPIFIYPAKTNGGNTDKQKQ
ncbi:MAG: hypothetical protein OJF59_001361 [Cytophagales bacterium]|jgi:hypothetical protein|nr:MAG: hypothetical protein OJF59_001361 [Cytophagales bacterium]